MSAATAPKYERVKAMTLDPDRKEIARYLGYHGIRPDAEIEEEIELCVEQLGQVVTPRFVYEKFDITVDENAGEVGMAGFVIRSRDLAKNLRGCKAAYLMAVTLGPGPDALVRRASIGRMSRAVILQAAAAAMVEVWCDEINARILREAARDGLYPARPRFSPGYGDLPLDWQRQISALLNMPKEIGVSLTDTLLMTPSKSVTAFVGVTDSKSQNTAGGANTDKDSGRTADGANTDIDSGRTAGVCGEEEQKTYLPGGHSCRACSMADTCAYSKSE